MAWPSPLMDALMELGAILAPYGRPGAEAGAAIPVAMAFGPVELEYAALRKHAVLVDWPQRGVVRVTGEDRREFLNRMLTQELKDLAPGMVRRSFWLSRAGRIESDLRVIEVGDATLLEMDAHATERTVRTLSAYVVTERVEIADATQDTHRLGLHGPAAGALLVAARDEWAEGSDREGDARRDPPERDRVSDWSIAGVSCRVFRDDTAGEAGYELIVPAPGALAVHARLVERGCEAPVADGAGAGPARHAARAMASPASAIRLRHAGWLAYNIARIEAGTALFNIDFGTDSLPAESGVLMDRVSFKKGCYLGQEIVARMHARGQAKQRLVAVEFEGSGPDGPILPEAGANLRHESGEATSMGSVTSSTISPMLGGRAIGLAMVKGPLAAAGTRLACDAPGGTAAAVVRDGLRHWSRPGAPG